MRILVIELKNLEFHDLWWKYWSWCGWMGDDELWVVMPAPSSMAVFVGGLVSSLQCGWGGGWWCVIMLIFTCTFHSLPNQFECTCTYNMWTV